MFQKTQTDTPGNKKEWLLFNIIEEERFQIQSRNS